MPVQGRMADSAIASNAAEYQKVARAAAELEGQVTAYGRYKHAVAALQEAKEMLRESDSMRTPVHVLSLGAFHALMMCAPWLLIG